MCRHLKPPDRSLETPVARLLKPVTTVLFEFKPKEKSRDSCGQPPVRSQESRDSCSQPPDTSFETRVGSHQTGSLTTPVASRQTEAPPHLYIPAASRQESGDSCLGSDRQTDRQTDGRTDGRTDDGRTDVRTDGHHRKSLDWLQI